MTFAQRLDQELLAGQPQHCLTPVSWSPCRLSGLEGVLGDYSLMCCIADPEGFQDGQDVKGL